MGKIYTAKPPQYMEMNRHMQKLYIYLDHSMQLQPSVFLAVMVVRVTNISSTYYITPHN